MMMMQ